MPACNMRGVYTIATKGANQTPKTSHCHNVCFTASEKYSHPNAGTRYSAYLITLSSGELEGLANDSGIPRVMARRAASEKLRTDTTDMRVLARHNVKALRIR